MNNKKSIEIIFGYLKTQKKVELWDREHVHRGYITGFDKHMNVVFQNENKKFLIKGDCITSIFGIND